MSLLFLLNVPLGVSTSYDRGAIHLLRLPVLSSLVSIPDLQQVLVRDPEPCDINQNCLSASDSAPPPFQPQVSYLEHEVFELL